MASWKSPAKKKSKTQRDPGTQPAAQLELVGPPSAHEVPMLVMAREAALDALGFELVRADMLEAATRTRDLADKFRLEIMNAQPTTPACRKGCSWCCFQKVGVTVPELLAIAEHLQASPQQLAVVRAKVAELAKDPRVLSDSEKPRARIACALLAHDGSCGVYEVRPIPCRGWLSTDEQSCIQHLDAAGEPQFIASAMRSSRFVQLGLAKAMDDVKRKPYLVELTTGLDIALNVPNAIERWLAGEPVFEPASATGK